MNYTTAAGEIPLFFTQTASPVKKFKIFLAKGRIL